MKINQCNTLINRIKEKIKRIENIQSMFSGKNGTELENNNREMSRKFPNTWVLNSLLLSNIWVNEESFREI